MGRKDTGKEIVQIKDKSLNYFSYNDKVEFLKEKESSYFNDELDSECVKGRLKKRRLFWEQLGANKFILNILKEGYKMPFISTPPYKISRNNKSAFDNESFVTSTVKELLRAGSVIEVPFKPAVVNPLSVNTRPSGKQRLILDLRHVNEYLVNEHVKFEDWRAFSQFVCPNGFLFKFDLKKGYHHIDIAPEFQLYLGFSWKIDNVCKFFVYTVLPFGLSTAPGVFTKLLRPLVSKWHKQGIKIAVYLDDGAGTDVSNQSTKQASKMTRSLLRDCGFVENETKSQWEPVQIMTWLGVEVDLNNNTYSITRERVDSLLSSINFLLKSPYTSARSLSKIAGKIVSMKFVLQNVIRLQTRYIYKAIDDQLSWDGRFNILNYPETIKEIIFWRDNVNSLNKKCVIINNGSKTVIYSDASNVALGAVLKQNDIFKVSHRMFEHEEVGKSSTWRELEAIRFGLESFQTELSGKSIVWMTDNMAAMYISARGSRKSELQELAKQIYNLTRLLKVDFEVQWIPREENETADYFSKMVDPDDWEVTQEFFHFLQEKWGPFTVDRFASNRNTKCERFNSKYSVPGTEAVDAFTQDWRFENNFIVPPTNLIIRVLNYIKSTRGVRGVLVIPYWPASIFWSILRAENGFAKFISRVFNI